MENYLLVSQWAAGLNSDKALNEIVELKAKYPWLKCSETLSFVQQMSEDLPKIMNIIKLQEKQNAILRHSEEKLHGYIKANQMADECILDDIAKRFNIEL